MSSNYPPTPSFGGHYNPSQQWPRDPPSSALGEGSDAYHPPPLIPPQPQAYSTNSPGFKSSTQIPGFSGNNNAPMPFAPPFPFMPPFHPSSYQPDPYVPAFAPSVGFPQQAIASQPQQNGLSENIPPIRTGATIKENDTAATAEGSDPMESPESTNFGDREEGELSNGEIEEEEPESYGYQDHQPKEDTAGAYLLPHRPNEKFKRYNGDGAQGICAHPALWQQPTDHDAGQPSFSHSSRMRQQPPEGPRNSNKLGRHQFPHPNKTAAGFSGQDVRPADLDTGTCAVHGGSAQDKLGSRDHHTVPMEDARSSRESLPVSSVQSPASCDKTDITTNGSRTYPSYGKSPAQLRVQAQGALLGLAPHNIKFDELVNEGIDPVILKRLYDEIGLKITSTRNKQHATTNQSKEEKPTSVAKPLVVPDSDAETAMTPVSRSAPDALVKSPNSEVVPEAPRITNHQPTQGISNALTAGSSKPMERKDIIARMLANKAGKSSSTTEPAKPEDSKKSIPLQKSPLVPANDTASTAKMPTSQSPPQVTSETRAKEKNKAQTELARQRMEQLKKQGLGRSQTRSAVEAPVVAQRLPASSSLTRSSQNSTSPSQSSQPLPSLSHPLPSRPPAPEPTSTARIPGLFMTSSEPNKAQEVSINNNTTPSTEPSSTKIRAPRKRPRASDFTDEPSPALHKTQFAQEKSVASTQHKVIIDISEDEFMYGSDNDTAEPKGPGAESPFVGSGRTSTSNQLLTRDLPPLSDFPSRNYSHRSTPAVSTPQPRNRGKGPDDLNAELQAMRQRIAEYEKRKKAKQSASRVESPGALAHSATTSADENSSVAPEVRCKPTIETELAVPLSSQPENSLVHSTGPEKIVNSGIQASLRFDDALRSQSVLTQGSLDPTHIESIRKKFMRKREIESGLPVLEAELQRSEARLRQFREEEQRLLAEIEKGKAGKRLLIEELEALGIETAGQSIEELQATKDRLEEADEDEDMRDDQGEFYSQNGHYRFELPRSLSRSAPSIGLAVRETHPSVYNFLAQQHTPKETTADFALNIQESALSGVVQDHGSASSIQPSAGEQTAAKRFETVPKTSQEAIDMRMSPPKETSVLSQADIADDGTTCSSSAMDESMGSTQDMLDLEETQALEEPAASRSESIAESKITEMGERSAQASVSPGPLHTGLENKPAPPLVKPDNSGDSMSYQGSSSGSDGYEPPEPDPTPEQPGLVQTSPCLVLPDEVEHVAADSYSTPQDENVLTLDTQGAVTDLGADSPKAKEDAERAHRYFTPYRSPLRLFKAYRYHPRFTEDVSGGYRSLTYSHNIDPHNYICPYEAAGGFCNDHSCEYQHFRDMTLSDDRILVEMSSLREGKTPEERDQYVAGLKQTIGDMRRDKVKDLNTIATEVTGYRRRFLHDPSRVLAL
ncbi:hypothetical protein EMPG_12816 [Blastomyces silverae]|uniref:Putative zinc-finger domain-containing protein n=1 Tax=Blastomyces silverae TaxID=2060906 RepID=A0A0H1BKK5_9EURO|nr:hypothetical protein EMPG_12816 [Blastomyces silverae]